MLCQVYNCRNIGAIEDNKAASDNDWETISNGGESKIKKWIADQMYGRTCTVVLVGANTANRKWINHEIAKSWNDGLGVVGLHIHGLKDSNQNTSNRGGNPFDHLTFGSDKRKLSSIVKCYNPGGSTTYDRYDWIKANLANDIEEAIKIRKDN